jgi:indole-3-glycerol phosphate synthase
LKHFHELATEAGLAALVEVHDEKELDRALAIDARLVGVNNRDLKTFVVDLATTETLARKLFAARTHEEVLLVAESGIHARSDVERVARAGAGAVLVGESLMRGDIAKKAAELIG